MLSKPLSFAAHLLIDNTKRTLSIVASQAEEFSIQQFTFDFPPDLFVEVRAALEEWDQSIQNHVAYAGGGASQRSYFNGYGKQVLKDPVLSALDQLAACLAQSFDLPDELFKPKNDALQSVCWQQSHFLNLQQSLQEAEMIIPPVKSNSLSFR